MILVVYLLIGHGIFHPVCSSFIFPQIRFWERLVLSSQIEQTSEKRCQPLPWPASQRRYHPAGGLHDDIIAVGII